MSRPETPRAINSARAFGIEQRNRNTDVFHYRHSGGICPAEYKVRSSSPAWRRAWPERGHPLRAAPCVASLRSRTARAPPLLALRSPYL